MNCPHFGDPYRTYREQQVSSLSTGRLVLLAYETALKACRRGQRGLLVRVLEELLSAIDLEQGGEVAAGLLRMYEYCHRLVREGRLGEVEAIVCELRDVWEKAVLADESGGIAAGADSRRVVGA